MPVDAHAFNQAFTRARDRVRGGTADLAAEQARLRALIPADASQHERTWTSSLIDDLAAPPPPPPVRSELYKQAERIHAEVYPPKGTTEEKIALLEDGRRRIWALADLETPDAEYDIRALTYDLKYLEDALRNPPFPLTDEPFPTSDA
ncbi:hypothetical protein [Kribbella sp. NPDC004536]|uniref:hypothetical protein n=1 Tax=Kribbella sp. NPDC004536 TaxID=3364106 RepID=UPI003693646D